MPRPTQAQAPGVYALAFGDQHGLGITLRSLARLRAASGDTTLAVAVAQALGVSEGEAERRLLEAAPANEDTGPPVA